MNARIAAMPARTGTPSHHDQDIALLARESLLPVREVTRLLDQERARLAVGARMTTYLPIFAFRNVRAKLRRNACVKRKAAA
jgi:hypothetical protein